MLKDSFFTGIYILLSWEHGERIGLGWLGLKLGWLGSGLDWLGLGLGWWNIELVLL